MLKSGLNKHYFWEEPKVDIFLLFSCLLLIIIFYNFRIRLVYYSDPENSIDNINRLQEEVTRYLLMTARTYVGFKVIIESNLKKLPDTFLIISNHQSLVDIPILAYAFPHHNVRFVAKKELKYWLPTFSFFLRKGKHALIDRKGDFKTNRRELVKLARLSRKGICPAVFPEGTRSRTGKVGVFHSAAVRTILANSGLPILSVAISGGYKIAGLLDLLKNLKNCIYRVKVLSIYPLDRKRTEIFSILKKARDEISEQVESWKREKR